MTKNDRTRPSVVIIGRPNVGKSTLFNRLVGARRAIVGDEPGITRDRIYGRVAWRGREFEIVDTGGIIPDDEALIPMNIFRQAKTALDATDLVLFIVDVREGITPLDEELARLLHKLGKPVFVLANKADSLRMEVEAEVFRRLGFDELFPVSAEHGSGIGDLLDAILSAIAAPESADAAPEEIKVAIIGKPNVGKSSLVNRLLGTERVIVSPIPGTTRDAIDTELEYDDTKFRLIDTAGIRRKSRVALHAEKIAVLMAERHTERADVAVLLIDAAEGPTAVDAKIAGVAHEAGKSLIIAVNKWDLIAKDRRAAARFEDEIRMRMKFLAYVPIVFISALTGQRVTKILDLAKKAYHARHLRIPTSELNRFFEEYVAEPRATGGRHRVRVQFLTQAATDPPTFVVFLNSQKEKLHFSLERYIENRLREQYEFFATPIKIKQRTKG